MRRFEQTYRMKDGSTRLGEAFFNAVFGDLDLRLHAQEEIEKDWLSAVDALNRFGLKRIDEFLAPTIGKVTALTELGFLECTSTTPLLFQAAPEKGVVVTEGAARDLFRPSPFLAVTRTSTPDDWLICRHIAYDRDTGALVFDVLAAHGDPGPHEDLVIHALAGSVLATMHYLSMGAAARDAAQTAQGGAETAQAAAEQAAADANVAAILIAGGPVSSVNGQVGAVTLDLEGPARQTTTAEVHTASTTVAVGRVYAFDTTTAGTALTATLPAAPPEGGVIRFVNASDYSALPLTIARNGATILGAEEDLILDTQRAAVGLVYISGDWRIVY